MSVTRDIFLSHIKPRIVMERLRSMGLREDRALAMLMGGCIILFMSQWPFRARQAHIEGATLTDMIQNDLVGIVFVLPLIAYGLAATLRIISRLFGAKADYYSARLALFWTLLATSPLAILSGLVKAFIGPGIQNNIVGFLYIAFFLWILINSLRESEL